MIRQRSKLIRIGKLESVNKQFAHDEIKQHPHDRSIVFDQVVPVSDQKLTCHLIQLNSDRG